MIKQAEPLSSPVKNASDFRAISGDNRHKVPQAAANDENKLRALLEKGQKEKKGDKTENALITSKRHDDDYLEQDFILSTDLQSRLFVQSLTKTPDVVTAKSNVQAWSTYVVNKVQTALSDGLQNSTMNLTLPQQHLNGSNIILSRDSQGAMSIVFMVGNLAVANQLQRELPALRKELEKKVQTSKLSLEIKQEVQVPPREFFDDERQQVFQR